MTAYVSDRRGYQQNAEEKKQAHDDSKRLLTQTHLSLTLYLPDSVCFNYLPNRLAGLSCSPKKRCNNLDSG